jgi:hypothetical protein
MVIVNNLRQQAFINTRLWLMLFVLGPMMLAQA